MDSETEPASLRTAVSTVQVSDPEFAGPPKHRSPGILHRALLALTGAVVAWGAFAFGAVYPWAYTPLAIGCAVVGVGSVILERRGRPSAFALSAGFAATALAVVLQLVPLSHSLLMSIGPGTDAFLRKYDLRYIYLAAATEGPLALPGLEALMPGHALSINPDKTALGLALFAAFAIFLVGASRLISAFGARSIGRFVVGCGALLALVGIIQAALTMNDRLPLIYGFWRPRFEARPFGPFVNPNHFAGWMLMALPLALGLFCDTLFRFLEDTAGSQEQRTSQVGELVVAGFAPLIMALSLLLTKSRSGIAAFAVGGLLFGLAVFRRQRSATGKSLAAVAAVTFLVGTLAWAGTNDALSKFITGRTDTSSVNARASAWRDTMQIVRDFPVAGTGLDTYGTAMMVYQTSTRESQFQEAHNDYLQLAAEGGLLLGVPILATLAVFLRDVRRRFREAPKSGTTYWLRVGAVVGLISIALQSAVEFSLQMPGNAALFVVLAAVALHQSPNLRRVVSTPPSAGK